MARTLRDIRNISNDSTSSYETALATSFDKRVSEPSLTEVKRKTEFGSENHDAENNISILSNDISMMSISSPKSPILRKKLKNFSNTSNFFTPNRQYNDSASKLLSSIKKEDERQLLFEYYPELFGSSQKPPQPPRTSTEKVIKTELLDYDDDKENLPPGMSCKPKENSRIEEEEKEDSFDEYLRKLREDTKQTENFPRRKLPTKFVVDDDEEECEKKRKGPINDDEYFLESLDEFYKYPRHSAAEQFVKDGAMRFKKNRETLLTKIAAIFRKRCFPEIGDEKLEMTWNARLRKSAGQCRNHSNGTSTIEMSPVVCTTAQRVRDTLVHEMCHAAVWIIDRLYKEGHGPGWKKWAERCMRNFKCLPVIERCHSYEIEAKFLYICVNEECKQTIKRQSKSLDIERKICGRCQSRFSLYRFDRRTKKQVLVEKTSANSKSVENEKEKREINMGNEFNEFVQENYWNYNTPGMKHRQIMELLAEKFKSK